MKAIILAAGYNRRLGNAISYPKCLLKIGKITLLENIIQGLKKFEVEVILVK